MSLRTESKLISLTSDTASQYNNSTFLSNVLYFLPGLLIKKPNIVNVEISVLHAEIPVSFYTINYTNNQLKTTIGGITTTISIPVGNYNANTLITAISTLLAHPNFTITIDKINGKLIFTHNQSFTIFTNNPNSIGGILGFNLGTTYTVSTSPYTLNALYPLNLLGIKKLNISSSKINTSNISSNAGTTSLLASIAVDQPSFGLIIYQNQGGVNYPITNREIDIIDILITDEYNNFINFNNINWSLSLCIFTTYDLSIDINNNLIGLLPPPTDEAKTKETKSNPILNDIEFLTN